MGLESIHKNLKTIDTIDIMAHVLDDLSDFIADLNRKRLIETGTDSNDNNIGEYTEFTTIIKETFGVGFGKITDHVTGFGTGESHKGIFSSVIGDELIVDTPGKNWPDFEDHFNNKQVLGLTKKEIKQLKLKALPLFWSKLYAKIFR